MQCTETKGLDEKLDDKTSGNAGFLGIKKRDLLLRDKPVFLDPQLLDFPVQRRAGNSDFRGRNFWPSNFPLAFDQSPARIPKGDRNCSKRKGTERMRQVVESQGPSAEATATTPAP